MHKPTHTQGLLTAFCHIIYKSAGRYYEWRGHRNNYGQQEDPGNIKTFQCFPPLSRLMKGLRNISALNVTVKYDLKVRQAFVILWKSMSVQQLGESD